MFDDFKDTVWTFDWKEQRIIILHLTQPYANNICTITLNARLITYAMIRLYT